MKLLVFMLVTAKLGRVYILATYSRPYGPTSCEPKTDLPTVTIRSAEGVVIPTHVTRTGHTERERESTEHSHAISIVYVCFIHSLCVLPWCTPFKDLAQNLRKDLHSAKKNGRTQGYPQSQPLTIFVRVSMLGGTYTLRKGDGDIHTTPAKPWTTNGVQQPP